MKNMQWKVGCVTLLLSASVLAESPVGPACAPLKPTLKNKMMVLNTQDNKQSDTSVIYYIKNISAKSIWLDHPSKRSANAGWSSYLRPHNWAAILLNKKDFELTCAVIQPGKVNYVNCGEALSVCAPEHASLDSRRKGSYWLVEDKTDEDFLPAIKKRGVK